MSQPHRDSNIDSGLRVSDNDSLSRAFARRKTSTALHAGKDVARYRSCADSEWGRHLGAADLAGVYGPARSPGSSGGHSTLHPVSGVAKSHV